MQRRKEMQRRNKNRENLVRLLYEIHLYLYDCIYLFLITYQKKVDVDLSTVQRPEAASSNTVVAQNTLVPAPIADQHIALLAVPLDLSPNVQLEVVI